MQPGTCYNLVVYRKMPYDLISICQFVVMNVVGEPNSIVNSFFTRNGSLSASLKTDRDIYVIEVRRPAEYLFCTFISWEFHCSELFIIFILSISCEYQQGLSLF